MSNLSFFFEHTPFILLFSYSYFFNMPNFINWLPNSPIIILIVDDPREDKSGNLDQH